MNEYGSLLVLCRNVVLMGFCKLVIKVILDNFEELVLGLNVEFYLN